LREDKAARDVRRESQDDQEATMAKAATANTTTAKTTTVKTTTVKTTTVKTTTVKIKPAKTSDVSFGGITLTSPDKVLYPDIGFTKLDLARYYEAVAPLMLPYVVNRPISLVRCPEGCAEDCFFQRHAMRGMSKAIKEVAIPGGKTKKKYLYIGGEDGLFGLAQIGVLEIHDWGVKLPKVSEPDHIVFDLDPDEGFDFDTLKAAAIEVRDFLDALGLTSFLKVTGGKGLHVVAPIAPKRGWDEVKSFCKAVAEALVKVRPDRYTANMAKAARKGKIFVDYLRNQRGGTAICNYSTRARPGATVACPIRWDELKTLETAAPYTAQNLPARLKRLKKDPWEGYFATRQSITVKAQKALGLA
jgi:bifunctional non-homologous end joining protein LigD